jgi:hypothetical protein
MFRRFLERLGILKPLVCTRTDFLVTVFLMSEGTAQGIPRPLQVFKFTQSYNLDEKHTAYLSIAYRIDSEISSIIRRGYTRTLADGTKETYAPHTIYKVTSKEVTDED